METVSGEANALTAVPSKFLFTYYDVSFGIKSSYYEDPKSEDLYFTRSKIFVITVCFQFLKNCAVIIIKRITCCRVISRESAKHFTITYGREYCLE